MSPTGVLSVRMGDILFKFKLSREISIAKEKGGDIALLLPVFLSVCLYATLSGGRSTKFPFIFFAKVVRTEMAFGIQMHYKNI